MEINYNNLQPLLDFKLLIILDTVTNQCIQLENPVAYKLAHFSSSIILIILKRRIFGRLFGNGVHSVVTVLKVEIMKL